MIINHYFYFFEAGNLGDFGDIGDIGDKGCWSFVGELLLTLEGDSLYYFTTLNTQVQGYL